MELVEIHLLRTKPLQMFGILLTVNQLHPASFKKRHGAGKSDFRSVRRTGKHRLTVKHTADLHAVQTAGQFRDTSIQTNVRSQAGAGQNRPSEIQAQSMFRPGSDAEQRHNPQSHRQTPDSRLRGMPYRAGFWPRICRYGYFRAATQYAGQWQTSKTTRFAETTGKSPCGRPQSDGPHPNRR